MPTQLIIPIHTDAPFRPLLPAQRAMHAIFLAALQRADPALSQAVHDAHVKPFTQSLRWDRAAERAVWQVTLLDDALQEPFQAGLTQLAPDRLLDHTIRLDVAESDLRRQSYEELAQQPPRFRYALAFHTPTTFKQSNRHQPIPDPYRCFQSWWSRWAAFAPPDLAINVAVLDIVANHAAVSAFRLRSHSWADGRRRFIGAVGEMKLVVLGRRQLEDHWWRATTSLVAFAPYCGTGHKTTQGLGQTSVDN